jgi:hypothetical protein
MERKRWEWFAINEEFDECRHSDGVPADLGDLPCRYSLPVLRILALCDNLT